MNRKARKGFTEPMRTCIGCRESKPKQDMIRIAFYQDDLSVDVTGRAKGRGVYICRDVECLEKAIKSKAIKRGFKTNFDDDVLDKVYSDLRKVIDDAF